MKWHCISCAIRSGSAPISVYHISILYQYIVSILVYGKSILLVYQYISILLVYQYISILVFYISMSYYISIYNIILVYQYISILVYYLCILYQYMYQYISILVHQCTSILYQCAILVYYISCLSVCCLSFCACDCQSAFLSDCLCGLVFAFVQTISYHNMPID